MRFVLLLCLLICLLPISAQEIALPKPNPDYDALKDSVGRSIFNTVPKQMRKCAVKYQVMYATTDMEKIDDVYQAARKSECEVTIKQREIPTGPNAAHLHDKPHYAEMKETLLSPAPEFDPKLKKKPDLRRENPFLINTITLNKTIYELLEAYTDPADRLLKFIELWHQYPAHPTTHVVLAEVYWALGEMDLGDFHVNRAMEIAPPSLFWPIMIVDAKRIARRHGYTRGLQALEQAKMMAFLPGNPAEAMYREWQNQAKLEIDAPIEVLFAKQQWKLLGSKLEETQSAEKMLFLSQAYSEMGEHQKAFDMLEDTLDASDNPVAILQSYLERPGYMDSSQKRAIGKWAKKLSKKDPKNGMLHFASTFGDRNFKKRKKKLAEAYNMAPHNLVVLNGKLLNAVTSKNYDLAIEIIDKMLSLDASAHVYNTAIAIMTSFNRPEAALLYYQFAKDKQLDDITTHREIAKLTATLPHTHPQRQELKTRTLKAALEAYKAHDYARTLDLLFPLGHELEQDPAMNLWLANTLHAANLLTEALPFYEKAAIDYPNEPAVWELLGNARLAADKKVHSTLAYEKARQLQPDRPGIDIKLKRKQPPAFKDFSPYPPSPYRYSLFHHFKATFEKDPIKWETGKASFEIYQNGTFASILENFGRREFSVQNTSGGLQIKSYLRPAFRSQLTNSYVDGYKREAAKSKLKDISDKSYRFRKTHAFSTSWNNGETSYYKLIEETEPLLGDLFK